MHKANLKMAELFNLFLIVTCCFLNHVRCASVRRKFYHHDQRRNSELCLSNTEMENTEIGNNIKQFYCAADELKNIIIELIETENVAVMVTSQDQENNQSNEIHQNAACEIYAVAVLLKTKLKHFVFYEVNNTTSKINLNIIRLFESVLTILNSIGTIQWQLYEMKAMDKTCKTFISDHELEQNYDFIIKMNSGLNSRDILGQKSVIRSWTDYEDYSNNFCLSNLKIC